MTGTILRIARFAVHDGPGIRTTVFLKGCPLRCAWCHSPESQSPSPEFMPLPDRCLGCGRCVAACPEHAVSPAGREPGNRTGPDQGAVPGDAGTAAGGPGENGAVPLDNGIGKDRPGQTRGDLCRLCGACAAACPTGARVLAGQQMGVASLLEAVERDRVFYDESGGGVTLSGGEPLMQAPFVGEVVEGCHARGIHVVVDTSGFGDPLALDRIRPDLFLFDLKAIDEERHRAITGASNRVILENLARVAARARQGLVARLPLVPGMTDADENVGAIGQLVSSLGLAHIDVLPYHRAGLAKYERLGKAYALPDTQPPTPEQVQRAVEILSKYGLTVRVGAA